MSAVINVRIGFNSECISLSHRGIALGKLRGQCQVYVSGAEMRLALGSAMFVSSKSVGVLLVCVSWFYQFFKKF